MELDLRNYLLAHSAVIAILGSRIHWVRSTQGIVRPNVILHRIAGNRDTTNDGPSGAVASRVQADCLALDFETAKSAAAAIEAALSGMRGPYGSTDFQGCFLDAERTGEEDSSTPDKLLRISLDFIIFHGGL